MNKCAYSSLKNQFYILLSKIIMWSDQDPKKRKDKKKGQQVPISELGFKAKVYHGIQTQYRRQRTRYKAAKYGSQNSKQCFMGRLQFTLNTAQLSQEQLKSLAAFRGVKRQQWNKIRQIVYHSKQELHCAICLETSFQSPQMTSCGHVFCWHCILMHFYKSLKASFCPVCNQTYELQHIVTCIPLNTKHLKQEGAKVTFKLKGRREGDSRVYDPDSLEQDLSFARILRATPQKIVQIFEEQRRQVQANVKNCNDEEIKTWMQKVYSLSWQKVEKAQTILNKKQSHHQHNKKDRTAQGLLYSTLEQKDRNTLTTFYQQKSGHLLFLHPICDKFIRKNIYFPRQITQEYIYWQEAEYNDQMMKKYKQISHITVNQEIDLLILNIQNHISQELLPQFEDDIQKFKERKKIQMDRQDRESQRLSAQYQEQKEYMAKLKKMEESQFYDIKLPTTIDISQLNNNSYFPSLIEESQSMPEPQLKEQSLSKKDKKKKKVPQLNDGDFPDLLIKKQSQPVQNTFSPPQQILPTKSEQIPSVAHQNKEEQFPDLSTASTNKQSNGQGGKRKNKKQKFVNVTDMFFKQEPEQGDQF